MINLLRICVVKRRADPLLLLPAPLADIPKENYVIKQPVFFGGCKQDYICLSAPAIATIGQTCPNVTVREFESDHWVQLAAPDQLNEALLAWVQNIPTA